MRHPTPVTELNLSDPKIVQAIVDRDLEWAKIHGEALSEHKAVLAKATSDYQKVLKEKRGLEAKLKEYEIHWYNKSRFWIVSIVFFIMGALGTIFRILGQ